MCYRDYGNTLKRNRAKQRYEESFLTGEIYISRGKSGTPQNSSDLHLFSDTDSKEKMLRSKPIPFDKKLCVVW